MSRVSINAGLLQMIVNGLKRDFAEGKTIRGEWVEEIEKDVQPVKEPLPVAESSDGWIPWADGKCPVGAKTGVQVKDRTGRTCLGAGWEFDWEHAASDYDILAYRIVRK